MGVFGFLVTMCRIFPFSHALKQLDEREHQEVLWPLLGCKAQSSLDHNGISFFVPMGHPLQIFVLF